jgi:hypothetical protein
MKSFKPLMVLSVVAAINGHVVAEESGNANEQKSNLRETSALIQLENTKLQREEENLNLKITIEQLKAQLNEVKNGSNSVTVEEFTDDLFNRNSSTEVSNAQGTSQTVGRNNPNGRTATQLNQRDIQNRNLSGLDVVGENGQSTNIDMETLNRLIDNAVSQRTAELEDSLSQQANFNTQSSNTIEDDFFGLGSPSSMNNEPEQESTDEPSSNRNNIPRGSDVSIQEVVINRVLERGNIKRADLSLTLEAQTPSNDTKTIEDFNVTIEEGQIYTWYDKVYEVRSISVRTIILFNATDNEEIVTHL